MTNKYICLKVYQRESWHRVSVEEINFHLTSIERMIVEQSQGFVRKIVSRILE